MKSKALIVTGENRIETGTIEVPRPIRDEILVETAYSCISPGTELRGMAGKQAGFPGFPYVPGYALSGVVVDAGPDATLPLGQPVFCPGTAKASLNLMWGGHTAYATRSQAEVFPVPDNVPLDQAAIVKLAAIAQRGVVLARPSPDENVAVVGLGPIGQLSARLQSIAGANVHAIDLSATRVATAQAAGVPASVSDDQPLAERFSRVFPDGVRIVVDTTGVPAVLKQSLQIGYVKAWADPSPGPRLVIQGSYPDDFRLSYDEAFRREVSIHLPRDQTPAELREVLALLGSGKLYVADLVANVSPPEACQSVYDDLRAAKDGLLTAVFRWK